MNKQTEDCSVHYYSLYLLELEYYDNLHTLQMCQVRNVFLCIHACGLLEEAGENRHIETPWLM